MRITFLSLAVLCALTVSGYSQVQSPQVPPRVVAQVSLADQTASIPSKTLFTPQKDGLFRLSVYLIVTGGDLSSNPYVVMNVSYTDDTGLDFQQYSFGGTGRVAGGCGVINPPFGPPCVWTTLVSAKAGTPIKWQTILNPTGSATYEVFATLEKLQPLE
jgi:hypothetical protein